MGTFVAAGNFSGISGYVCFYSPGLSLGVFQINGSFKILQCGHWATVMQLGHDLSLAVT